MEEQTEREKLLEAALEALYEAVSDAESSGHPLGGRAASNKAWRSKQEAAAAIRTLAALPPQGARMSEFMEEQKPMSVELARRIDTALHCGAIWTEGSEAHERMKQARKDFTEWCKAASIPLPKEPA